MGRSAYTPTTVSYIVHQSATSRASTPGLLARRNHAGFQSGSLSVGHEEIKYGPEDEEEDDASSGRSGSGNGSRSSSEHGAQAPKDSNAPLVWAQRSFDPDDKSLPAVTEVGNSHWRTWVRVGPEHVAEISHLQQRFLRPGEQYTSAVADADGAIDLSETDDDMHSEEEDEEEREAGSDAEELDEDGDQSVYEAEEDFPNEIAEQYQQYGNSVTFSTDEIDAYSSLLSSLGQAPTAPAALQSAADPSAPAQEGEADPAAFSPSSAVFHSHTLPFALPNAEEIQMQRRLSATATNAQQPANYPASSQLFFGGNDRMILL